MISLWQSGGRLEQGIGNANPPVYKTSGDGQSMNFQFLNSPLQYKSAHLWPEKQLYQRASAECVRRSGHSLVLSQLNEGQSTVLFQALLRNYIIKNSKFWITITKKLIYIWGNKYCCWEAFLYCFFYSVFQYLWVVSWCWWTSLKGKKRLWAGKYACLILHCSLKMTLVSLVGRHSSSELMHFEVL